MDLPLNTNFKGLLITSKEVKQDELLPSSEFSTEKEYMKLNLLVSVILTKPYESTEISWLVPYITFKDNNIDITQVNVFD